MCVAALLHLYSASPRNQQQDLNKYTDGSPIGPEAAYALLSVDERMAVYAFTDFGADMSFAGPKPSHV